MFNPLAGLLDPVNWTGHGDSPSTFSDWVRLHPVALLAQFQLLLAPCHRGTPLVEIRLLKALSWGQRNKVSSLLSVWISEVKKTHPRPTDDWISDHLSMLPHKCHSYSRSRPSSAAPGELVPTLLATMQPLPAAPVVYCSCDFTWPSRHGTTWSSNVGRLFNMDKIYKHGSPYFLHRHHLFKHDLTISNHIKP